MYNLTVKSEFSSAHRLRGYKGKCEALHGHNWKVELMVCGSKLDKLGMTSDFKELKERLNNILKDLDHSYLNDLAYFKKHNPTSENIAKYIFDKFNSSSLKLKLESVTVWESDSAAATYSKK
ncbi:MAG: 6-carboxytetrahydropterin synthase QueD [Candidatus Omnitrophota bacterium]|nr:6-carboxytetrahydropterin synthase QueD [Candidatus Omnitrophota bacterium]